MSLLLSRLQLFSPLTEKKMEIVCKREHDARRRYDGSNIFVLHVLCAIYIALRLKKLIKALLSFFSTSLIFMFDVVLVDVKFQNILLQLEIDAASK